MKLLVGKREKNLQLGTKKHFFFQGTVTWCEVSLKNCE